MKEKNTLQKLGLRGNQIGDDGASFIGKLLEINKSIEELDLGNNNITNAGALHILESLNQNSSVTRLNCNGNEIDIEILDQIGKKISENRNKRRNSQASQTIMQTLSMGSNDKQIIIEKEATKTDVPESTEPGAVLSEEEELKGTEVLKKLLGNLKQQRFLLESEKVMFKHEIIYLKSSVQKLQDEVEFLKTRVSDLEKNQKNPSTLNP